MCNHQNRSLIATAACIKNDIGLCPFVKPFEWLIEKQEIIVGK